MFPVVIYICLKLFDLPIIVVFCGGCLFPAVAIFLPSSIPSLAIINNILTLILF